MDMLHSLADWCLESLSARIWGGRNLPLVLSKFPLGHAMMFCQALCFLSSLSTPLISIEVLHDVCLRGYCIFLFE